MASTIGVCYGMLGNDLPKASQVIKMYQSNGITAMRLYNPDKAALEALKGTGIQLMLGVPNEELQAFASDSSNAAADWVRKYVQAYHPSVSFKYIAVGNEVITNSAENEKFVLPSMKKVYAALSSAGLQDQIKVSTAVHQAVLGTSYPPSVTAFSPEASPYMLPIVQFLSKHGAPLLANVYTYFPYVGAKGQISLDYALFKSGIVTPDGVKYPSLFDACLDAFYAALEKAGGGNVEVVVSESGWPSAGGDAATAAAATFGNAQTYNQNLIKHVGKEGKGTPRRPGKAIQTYIFAMFNENQKQGKETEKHFGLFYPNMKPVYPIKFN